MGYKKDMINKSFVGISNLGFIQRAMEIKHPTTISKYAQVQDTNSDIGHKKTKFLSLDIETDTDTGKTMLVGYADYNPMTKEKGYDFAYRNDHGTEEMLQLIAVLVKYLKYNNGALVYWSKFDALNLIRLMLEYNGYDEEEVVETSQRIAKGVSGYHQYRAGWLSKPMVSITLKNGVELGVVSYINDSIKLYAHTPTQKKEGNSPDQIWAYDGSKHWQNGLLKTVKEQKLKYAELFETYKNQNDLHNINWEKFNAGYLKGKKAQEQTDRYVIDVLKANCLDCFACKDLMERVQDLFINSFGVNPKGFISSGSLTKSAMAVLMKQEEREQIGIISQLQEWEKAGIDRDTRELVYNLAIDSYSAGMVDILKMGRFENVGFADISSAYPSIIATLYDLTGSTLNKGYDCNPPKLNGTNYIFATCRIEANEEDVHTLTLKVPGVFDKEFDSVKVGTFRDNFRPQGVFIVSGLWQEFELLQQQNPSAIIKVLEWVEIQTTGKPHPMQQFAKDLWDLRLKFKGDDREIIIKTILNSLYGKMFECIRQYEEYATGEIVFAGFRAGEYFNPIIATIITGFARLRLAETVIQIKKQGGKPIVLMTDAVYWDMGKETDPTKFIPKEFTSILQDIDALSVNGWTEHKTMGMFDKPQLYKNGLFLKPGFYEYYNPNKTVEWEGKTITGAYEFKTMGFFNGDLDPTQPYLLHKIRHAAKFPKEHKTKDGELCIRMLKSDVVGFGEIAEGFKNFMQLGMIDGQEVSITFDDIFPKRSLVNRFYEFEELLAVIDTIPTDAFNFTDGADFTKVIDGRLSQCRELFRLYSEFLHKGTSNKEKIKILCNQINENLPALGLTKKITQKKGSNNGFNGRDLGVQALRDMLLNAGIDPLA